MKVVIAGAGALGVSLASRLTQDGHHLVLVDRNWEHLKTVDEYLDIKTIVGDCTSVEILKTIDIQEINLLIAITGSDSFNILACNLFKKMGCGKCIARLSSIGYFGSSNVVKPRDMGIDLIIHPEKDIANEIFDHLFLPNATNVESFFHDRVKVIGFKVKENSPIIDRTLGSLKKSYTMPYQYLVLIRDKVYNVDPLPDEVFVKGDHFFVSVLSKHAHQISLDFCFEDKPTKNIFIGSGSNVSIQLTQKLEETNIQAKILEPDIKVCREMNHLFSKTLILQGSQDDPDLLEAEGVENADFFLALSNGEEKNILTAMLAKKMGAKKNMAMIFNTNYSKLLSTLDIDVQLSLRLNSIDKALRFVLQGEVVSVFELDESQLEIIEYRVTSHSVVVNMEIGSREFIQVFPKNTIVSYILNEFDEVVFPEESTVLSENDHVIVCTLADSIPDLEKIFV